eukprot:2648587-Rhodomonas_salina.3
MARVRVLLRTALRVTTVHARMSVVLQMSKVHRPLHVCPPSSHTCRPAHLSLCPAHVFNRRGRHGAILLAAGSHGWVADTMTMKRGKQGRREIERRKGDGEVGKGGM